VAALQPGHPEQQENHEGSDDGAEDAGAPEVVRLDCVKLDELPQEAADERADDAHCDRAEDADAVPARQKQARDEPGDESDDEQNNYESHHEVSSYLNFGQLCIGGWLEVCRGDAVWRAPAWCANLIVRLGNSGLLAESRAPAFLLASGCLLCGRVARRTGSTWPRRLVAQDAALSRR
jgi:hypothetical protein